MALPVMLKAALPAVPGVNQLPGVKKTSKTLPDLTLERNDVLVERSAVNRYAAVCGFPERDVAPVPDLHMLEPQPQDLAAPQPTQQHRRHHRPVPMGP